MRAGRAALARAIDSVVEGTKGVDWGLMTTELDNEGDRELLRHLHLLAQISDVQRSEGGAVDDGALRACARAIVSVLPIDDPPRAETDDPPPAGSSVLPPEAAVPAGRWGRLELLELVGNGTFGDVYRARDSHLQREVAVKLLHANSRQAGLVDRMLHEARALARVEHPSVVIVHDAEERDGRVGLCMEFVRGRTLADILASEGARGAGEAALIGQDLCQALAAVHAAGLVHGDIKAHNVMREEGGRVVLMDFGAGQAVGDGQARPARVTGTPLYLAPELLEHGEASVRSDIYSLGVLLYHLVTNDYPVRGQTTAELIEAHRQGRIRRLRDVAPALPVWFVRVVERAIAPNPRDRFATAGEFEAALSGRKSVKVWPLVLAVGLTLAVAAGVQQMWRSPAGPSSPFPRIALLPLDAGLGVDPSLADAVSDEIYQGLAMVDTLRITSPVSAAKAKREQLSMPQVAARLEASAVISGTVSRTGEQLEVKLRLFGAGSDSPRWAQTLQVSRASLGSLRRDGALSIGRAINVSVSPRILTLLNRPVSASTDAYDAYARGRALHQRARRNDLEQARLELEKAIQLDSLFAPAYAALARVHLDLGAYGRQREWVIEGPLARVAAEKALELDPGLAEAHVAAGQVAFLFDWDWPRAERAYSQAILLSPSYDYARQRRALLMAARGRAEEALVELDECRRLDPYSDTTDLVRVSVLQYARKFPEAETIARALLGRMPSSNAVHVQLGRILAATNRFDEAIEEFQKVVDPASGAYVEAEVASAHAGAGRPAEAEAILDRLLARAASEEIPPELFSLVATALGRFDEAFRHLEQAAQLKSRRVVWMKLDPRWDPLRSDPRFDSLVKRLGL
jgi:eukaryotic-like serine/threonine-protein kinase